MDVFLNRKTRLCYTLFVFICAWGMSLAHKKRTYVREHLSPPLDIELQAINCTAVRVRWRIPWRHVGTVTGYRVFYTQMRDGRPGSSAGALDAPLSLEMLAAVRFDGQTAFDVEVGSLRMAAQYVFSVGAYGWAGEGRPSVPRRVSTFPPEMCSPPMAPSQPKVLSLSDTETTLSWEHSESVGSVPVHFVVSYIRPEVDSEWTSIEDPVNSSFVVLTGLDPDTQYQFAVKAVNPYGASPPSPASSPVWTLRAEDEASRAGGQGSPSPPSIEEPADVGGVRYNIPVQTLLSSGTDHRRSELRSRTGISISGPGGRETTTSDTVTTARTTTPTIPGPGGRETTASDTVTTARTTTPTIPGPVGHPSTQGPETMLVTPSPVIKTSSVGPGPPHPHLPPSPPSAGDQWRGQVRGLYDLSCQDAACPPNSVCIDDYQSGGSRCYCALGRTGEGCSQAVMVRYPKFHGFSHVAFEPLKKSYHTFQITLDFKADSENGLLLFCGESEHGDGDFASLALLRGQLHFRFNCGTGAALVVSGGRVQLGRWHSVVIGRAGASGWLRLDNEAPVTGNSQGNYTKITFRTPLYVGGSPNAYWLVRAAGTNRGFQGCVQMLVINNRVMDMRPWPMGLALSGADVGVCSSDGCSEVTCAHGGTCTPSSAHGYLCLCPLGYRGRRCQESFVLVVPLFAASVRSYAVAPWPRSSEHYLSFLELEMDFLPAAPDGTLLYSQDVDSADFLSVTLERGHVELRFNCGSGTAVIRSEEPVAMNEWHELQVWRTGRDGIVQVDGQTPTHSMAEGAFTQIRCSGPLYIGGVPDYNQTKSEAAVLQPFSGSIQKISVNGHTLRLPVGLSAGVNLDNAPHPCLASPCASRATCQPRGPGYECHCPLGGAGELCQQEYGSYCMRFTDATGIPQFIGRSYLTYDKKDILKRISGLRTHVFLCFRSFAQDGLLLWRGHSPVRVNSDFVSLSLEDGALIFSYNLGSGVATVAVNGSFGDGQWHWVKAVREAQAGRLTVDHSETRSGRSPGNMRQLNTNTVLYLGGMKEIALDRPQSRHMWGLVGCIAHLSLSTGHPLALLDDAAGGKNINTCGT